MTRDEALAALTAPGQPFELATARVFGRDLRVFVNAPASLRALYADNRGPETFLVYGNERLTFEETWCAAARLAHLLKHTHGVSRGDRVAIAMRNYPEWVLAFMAATSLGAIAVAMNAWWQAEEMAFGLADCGAKVLIADAERIERALVDGKPPAGLAVLAVRPHQAIEGVTDLSAAMAGVGEVDMPAAEIAPDDDATIFYTSGSTGNPKGVVSTHRAIVSALLSWELDAQAAALVNGVEPPQPPHQAGTLMAVPLFHVTGSHAAYLMSYRARRKMVCMYKWDVEEAARLIEAEKLTSFVAPPAMTGDLERLARTTTRDLSSLMVVGGGGAGRAPEQVRAIDATFTQALPNTGWGMTETNAIGTGIGGLDYLAHPASSGRVSAIMQIKVMDAAGNTLPAGVPGELMVRGTSMFRGYWNRPDLAAGTFEDGWFRTGDVATIDAEGYMTIVDRIKDLIIRGGENIGCGHVEAALLMHPDVHEAVVYAVPDERLGEEVGATLHGAPGLDAEAVRAFLADHLAKFEIPRHIRISRDPLPRTASGKLLKRELRAAAVAAMQRPERNAA